MLEARNAGKPIGDARGEIGMVVDTFRYYAGAPERLLGDTIPVAGGQAFTVREPLGVVGLIVPWNFPLTIAAWKLGAGARGRQHRRAQARRADTADARCASPRSRSRRASPRASSTSSSAPAAPAGSGSSSTPTSPRSPSPARPRSGARSPPARRATIKRVTLELGGKSANVIFADADLEAAAAAAPMAVFGNAGQDCCARSRILVEESVLDRFMALLEEHVEAIRVGDPLDRGDRDGAADLGRPARRGRVVPRRRRPVADPRQRARRARLLVCADGPRARVAPTRASRARRSSGRSWR